MLIRNIAQASAFAGAVAISLWASAASAQSQSVKSEAMYAPIQSISYDFGSKSMSGLLRRADREMCGHADGLRKA
jgi:hypothetical protein